MAETDRRRPWAAILGSLVFLVVAPGTVAGLVPWLITGWRAAPPAGAGAALAVLGAAIIIVAVVALLDAFARFALVGLGTPAPVFPARRLVVSGLYRHVRNPMYLAVVGAVLGQALMLGDVPLAAYGAIVWLAFHGFVVVVEEPGLRRRHGPAYDDYRAAVRRWRPRSKPWTPPSRP